MRLRLALLALCLACTPLRQAPAPGQELRVLVFNIFAGKDTARAPSLDRVAALVRSTGADLVLLQEVDRGTRRSGGVDQPRVLAEATGYHVRFGRTIDHDGGQFGLAVLSRWPIASDTLRHYEVSHPPGSTGARHEARGFLSARVLTPGGPVTVVNTHLSAAGGDHYRLQEVAQLGATVAELAAGGEPVLVGGDFNARPDSEVMRRAPPGWRDAWTVCGDGGPGNTFPVRSPDRRIDYLFLLGEATCDSARVTGHGISDHLGLIVDVRVPVGR